MNKKILIVVASIVCATSTVQAERGFFEAIVSAAGYVYEAGYTTYTTQVQMLLDDLVFETRSFGRFFAPIHTLQLMEIEYMTTIIDREWALFLRDHEHLFGPRVADIISLQGSLAEVLIAMQHSRVSPHLLYDYELSVITRALDAIIYEIQQPILYADSIERINRSVRLLALAVPQF